jgi:hypothetical protein
MKDEALALQIQDGVCPITQLPFDEPYITDCCHLFSKRAIIQHLGQPGMDSKKCPVCRKPVKMVKPLERGVSRS